MTLRTRASFLTILFLLPLLSLLSACSKINSLTINPTQESIYVGQTVQYQAIAQEQTGSGPITMDNVTDSVTWTTSNSDVATINSAGLATAVGTGETEIIASSSNNAVAYATLTVQSQSTTGGGGAGTPSIAIQPGTATETFVGETTQFLATGSLTGGASQDITNQVSWVSSNAQVATINSAGLATAVGSGTTNIVAEGAGITSNAATITVNIPSTGGGSGTPTITIQPGTATETFVGETTQFLATGNLTGGASQNITSQVTWSSSNAQVATINSTGLATAVAAGSTTILAVGGGITSNAATITVSVPSSGGGSGSSIASIAVIPGTQTVSSPGSTTQYLAIGTTGAGSTVNLTNQVAWSTSSAQIATIGAATGLASAVGQGTTTVAAIYSNGSGGTLVGTATMTVSGGTAEKYTGVSVTPNTATISASGQTSQLIALATTGVSGLLTDVTSSPQITWSSSQPSLATVSTTGLVTGRNAGTTQITAELTNPDSSVVTSTANVTVTLTSAPEPLISLTVIPNSITVGNLQDTGQFLAIGTYATAPYTRDLTNSPNLVWISDAANIFPISTNSGGNSGASAGIVTAYGNGGAVIIAEATNPGDGTIQTATATFNCPLVLPNPTGNPPTPGSCFTGSQAPSLLATLTVYNQGLNTSNWLVTASSATGTANVIHCGPGWSGDGNSGGSVCTATYPIGTVVTLTAPAQTGVNFGGWTSNCTGQGTVTAAGPNSCTVTLSTNDTVGGIFN